MFAGNDTSLIYLNNVKLTVINSTFYNNGYISNKFYVLDYQ